MAYIDTAVTGGTMNLQTPQGTIRFERTPFGVQMTVNGLPYVISKEGLSVMGRFFLAASILHGQDVNDGWDQPQSGGQQSGGLIL